MSGNAPAADLCLNGKIMQYYKGKALYPEDEPAVNRESKKEKSGGSHSAIIRWLIFPFVLCYWFLEGLVYKSLEE